MKNHESHHDLEKAIPFLVARAGARMGNAFSRALKPFGLSLSEWRVCASLQYAPRQSLSELSLQAASDLSALSRIIDRLEGYELVVRERSTTDGRSIRLVLTPKGIELTRRITPLAKQYESVALEGFTRDEVKSLRLMLVRLYENSAVLDEAP